VTGIDKNVVKVFPNKGKREFKLMCDINLNEHLQVYGVEFKLHKPKNEFKIAQNIYKYFLKVPTEKKHEISQIIYQERIALRKNYNKTPEELGEPIVEFLKTIEYPTQDGCLKYKDVKYLTGEWLEEYVYYKIKSELNLDDHHIAAGLQIRKKEVPNELDVAFVYNHQLYVIECKTSIKEVHRMPGGSIKERSVLGDVIYKSDSLRPKFGLFAKSSIIVLSELRDENLNPLDEFKNNFRRAELSNIKIISKRQLQATDQLSSLII
jgi:hypothetical protein